MIAKGKILSIDFNSNTCSVHVPIFDTAGIDEKSTVVASICITPGIYNCYNAGDVVFVGFENNCIDLPVVLGKLYTNNSIASTGAIIEGDINITNSAILPTNTTIGNISYTDLYNNIQKTNQVSELVSNEIGRTFSTNEKIIGRWIDNKILYSKTFKIDKSISMGTDFSENISLTDINFNNIWVDLTNTIQIGEQYSLNEYNAIAGDYWNTFIDTKDKKLYYRGHSADNIYKFIITLNYTKK